MGSRSGNNNIHGRPQGNVSSTSLSMVPKSFEVFTATGAKNKAVIQQFTANASSTGQYAVTFSSVADNSLLSGIEAQ